jgi:hypothetical protein
MKHVVSLGHSKASLTIAESKDSELSVISNFFAILKSKLKSDFNICSTFLIGSL